MQWNDEVIFSIFSSTASEAMYLFLMGGLWRSGAAPQADQGMAERSSPLGELRL